MLTLCKAYKMFDCYLLTFCFLIAHFCYKLLEHSLFLNSSLFFRQQMVVPGGMPSYLGAKNIKYLPQP